MLINKDQTSSRNTQENATYVSNCLEETILAVYLPRNNKLPTTTVLNDIIAKKPPANVAEE